MYGFVTIEVTIRSCAPSMPSCSSVGGMPHDLRRARWQVLHHRGSRPTQQHRFQVLTQDVEVLVAEHSPLLVSDTVAIEEPERGAKPPVIDELDDGEEVVEPVLERRAGEHQREGRPQALHRLRRLRLPVLDALAFIQNDEVPLRAFDGKKVAQYLLVVADREEAVAPVLAGPRCRASENDLTVPLREAKNLAAPLGFDGCRADDQYLADVRLPREQFSGADALDRLAQAHVVRKDCAPGTAGKRDAVELVGQELDLQQCLT
jgi:hypothetical protein